MHHVDLLIHSAAQVATCAAAQPLRGAAMRDPGVIAGGALAMADGRIVAVGPSAELRRDFHAAREIDASGSVLCPGFVDPHTHVVFAGDRVNEFELKLGGTAYLDILAAGGGIVSTMRATRAATHDALVEQSGHRLAQMLAQGTTTVESKTGYGLSLADELKQLAAMATLALRQPVELVPTLLSAHAVPPEYKERADDYVRHVIDVIIPAAAAWLRASPLHKQPMRIDVFCEMAAFSPRQAQAVLAAGRAAGMDVTAHVDQFNALGGLDVALELGALSVDHLDVTGDAGITRIAASNCVAVVIPTATFNFGGDTARFARARNMIDAGCALALCTDLNPGSAPCPSMPLAMAIACRYQKLTPAEALVAGTINAAHALGLGHRIGSLEAGKQADVVIIDAPDYRHLAYQFGANLVRTIIKCGEVVHER